MEPAVSVLEYSTVGFCAIKCAEFACASAYLAAIPSNIHMHTHRHHSKSSTMPPTTEAELSEANRKAEQQRAELSKAKRKEEQQKIANRVLTETIVSLKEELGHRVLGQCSTWNFYLLNFPILTTV